MREVGRSNASRDDDIDIGVRNRPFFARLANLQLGKPDIALYAFDIGARVAGLKDKSRDLDKISTMKWRRTKSLCG